MLPIIDGHFWIVRDGNILDTYFDEYDIVKKIHNLTGNMVYKEADAFTQALMVLKFRKSLEKCGINEDKYVALKREVGMNEPRPNDCYFNCLLVMKEGDELKFGSMGWKKSDGSGIWWEFGGEDWTGIKSFLK